MGTLDTTNLENLANLDFNTFKALNSQGINRAEVYYQTLGIEATAANLSNVSSYAMLAQSVVNNPVMKVSRLKESRGRVRFLSDSEREALLAACHESDNKYLYSIVVLALSTGARKNEVLNLKWENVDFNRQVITLHETKNGERRLLPLQGYAYELILALSKRRVFTSEHLFPSDRTDKPVEIKKAWEISIKRAGIEDFRFHDLRHSTASYLAMDGASMTDIAEVLGHKTLQMVKRYAHYLKNRTENVEDYDMNILNFRKSGINQLEKLSDQLYRQGERNLAGKLLEVKADFETVKPDEIKKVVLNTYAIIEKETPQIAEFTKKNLSKRLGKPSYYKVDKTAEVKEEVLEKYVERLEKTKDNLEELHGHIKMTPELMKQQDKAIEYLNKRICEVGKESSIYQGREMER